MPGAAPAPDGFGCRWSLVMTAASHVQGEGCPKMWVLTPKNSPPPLHPAASVGIGMLQVPCTTKALTSPRCCAGTRHFYLISPA